MPESMTAHVMPVRSRIGFERGIRLDGGDRTVHQRLDLEVGPQLVDDAVAGSFFASSFVEFEQRAPLFTLSQTRK